MKKIWPFFLLALALRIVLSPIYHHSDADTIFYWGKYLWEKKDFLYFLGKAVPDAMPAVYPPIFYYLLFIWQGFYDLVGKIFWWSNLKWPLFPSSLIFWYQSFDVRIAFNKIPAILADLGCAWLIYSISRTLKAKESFSKLTALFFLFLPFSWYNSAYWGQVDSLYSFFILLGFFLILRQRYLLAIFLFGVSVLIKSSGIVVLPAVLILVVKKKRLIDLWWASLAVCLLAFILYFPFQPLNTLSWAVNFYLQSFRGELNYLVSNAFNFWALLFGFDQRSDGTTFWGIPFRLWGFLLFFLLVIIISAKLWQKTCTKQFILAAFLSSFAAFLFLPRIHERYFYTALLFSAILGSLGRKWLMIFILLSMLHFFNLYHFWWHPGIAFLTALLSNMFIIRAIIVSNIIIFGYCCFLFVKNEPVGNNR